MELILRFLNWKTVSEIIILWAVIYQIFLFLQGTKAVYLLRGIIILLISFLVFQKLGLFVLSWLFTKLFAFVVILMLITLQPELREGLIRLGRGHIFYMEPKKEEIENAIREIVAAAGAMARKRIGALIAVRRELSLKNVIESGVTLQADLSGELLQNIFYPSAPLHDGGVVVEGTRLVAAACLFPLSENPQLERTLGMRHRAGVGLSENSDALVVIVSEETGSISLAINGQLTRNLSPNDLLTILKGQLTKTV